MKEEYISISEFARRAGVSRQAIQQRLDTTLREYVKVEQGRKRISINGLRLFDGASLAQENDKDCQGKNDVDMAVIELLRKELEAKDKQIEQLQKLLDQEQQLHAATAQRLLLLEQPKQTEEPEEPEETEEAPTEKAAPVPEPKRGFWQWLFGSEV